MGRTTASASPASRRARGRAVIVDISGSAPTGIPTSSAHPAILAQSLRQHRKPLHHLCEPAPSVDRCPVNCPPPNALLVGPPLRNENLERDVAAEANRASHLRLGPALIGRVRHRGDPQGPHPRRARVPLPHAVDRGCCRVLLVAVVISYRQVVMAYPSGGGSYEVVRDNLGQRARHGRGRVADGRLRHDGRGVRGRRHRQRHLRGAGPERRTGSTIAVGRHRGADPDEPARDPRVGPGVRCADVRVRGMHPGRQRGRPRPGRSSGTRRSPRAPATPCTPSRPA